MRYSIVFVGALATAATASPAAWFKRYYVTEYAYVTDVVTVTAGQEPAAPTTTAKAEEVSVAAVPTSKAWGEGGWWGGKGNGHGYGDDKPTTSAPPPPPPTTSSTPPPPPPPPTTTSPPPPPPPPPTTTSTPPPPPPPPATTTKKAAPPPSPKPAPGYSSGGKPSYSEVVVMHHNIHRANHSAPDIEWDAGLASTALKIAQGCNYAHDVEMDGGGYGQNIAAGAPSDNVSSIITDHFYNAEIGWFEPFYHEATPSDMSDETFDKFGHFTQIVWKKTTKVGCATYNCAGHGKGPKGLGSVADNVPPFFTVCNYSPPGNYLGQFGDNISPGEGQPTENWSYGL